MQEEIRLLEEGEQEELQRFLERSFGHGRSFFIRRSPNLWAQATECALILKSEGKIVGHVGTYPLELVVGPSTIITGAISGVATDPEARGKGYMSKLMDTSIRIMEERKMPLSVLWGDRQRYGHFGYEHCGQKYLLDFNRRSLARAGIKPAIIEEVDPGDPVVISNVCRLHSTLEYRVARQFLELVLLRSGVRVFMGDDGYLISRRETGGDLVIQEVVSPGGKEPELILGAIDWTFGQGASFELEAISTPSQRRLYEAASYWTMVPQGMFRIVDWPRLACALSPYFGQAATKLPPFEISIGCQWQGKVQVATITWDGSNFTSREGRGAASYVELEEPQLVGALLGGPFFTKSLGLFGRLLPVPIHIPYLDKA